MSVSTICDEYGSLCQAVGKCRRAEKHARSQIENEQKPAGREKRRGPESIFSNTLILPLLENTFLWSKCQKSPPAPMQFSRNSSDRSWSLEQANLWPARNRKKIKNK